MADQREIERIIIRSIKGRPADGTFEEVLDATERSVAMGIKPVERAWASRHFTVQLRVESAHRLLSIQRSMCNAYIRESRKNKRPITWDELQEVKSLVGYGDQWAVEVYPPCLHVVNVAWMRHLWLVGAEEVPFGWRNGTPDG